MSSPTTPLPLPPYNYSYTSIPLAYGLSILPHAYGLTRLMLATRGQISNSMPRTNLEAWKSKLPTHLWNQLARARGAHLNSLEVFPLFAAAMVAGNVAGLDVKDLNGTAASFFLARGVYMVYYIGVRNEMMAMARTGLWAWSISIPIMALIRAGRKAAENSQ
ncbi:hypothetical protein M409DRAFT_18481 [Zasmidium cellare ATCC 36951]|uniref:MAPEG family protein n=1 Tax=Zasmidium cellare ATCC 36951 TaxID=1080233 RepID=A0A6A6CWG9_ZASCE|nr:uncharacterized protein M409DRAFT_18481 [Zasmidium cellare ATCC 36951]KAF2171365.1 hypothetical protein M409DRAFT_18481 [Zasmidium cellare ATCC 36951]